MITTMKVEYQRLQSIQDVAFTKDEYYTKFKDKDFIGTLYLQFDNSSFALSFDKNQSKKEVAKYLIELAYKILDSDEYL